MKGGGMAGAPWRGGGSDRYERLIVGRLLRMQGASGRCGGQGGEQPRGLERAFEAVSSAKLD